MGCVDMIGSSNKNVFGLHDSILSVCEQHEISLCQSRRAKSCVLPDSMQDTVCCRWCALPSRLTVERKCDGFAKKRAFEVF
jgi:hypothetical protein